MESPRILRARAGLVVVDVQERLLPAMHNRQSVLDNTVRLVEGAAALGIPTVFTEQYRKGLGGTVPELAATRAFDPVEKLAFSCCGEPRFLQALTDHNLHDIILAGIEAHVCVTQTCLDLLHRNYRVFAVADATSSRTPENHRLALERMRSAGAQIVSTEMILFELLDRAGTEEFKHILKLVK